MELRPADPREEPAASLLDEMVAELRVIYAMPEGLIGVPLDPAELAPPEGTYLVGWEGSEAVAGGGVRRLGPSLGEVKRMYVRPSHRGRGLASELLSGLEDAAAAMGLSVVRLDTGPAQPAARHLYESRGYRPIGNYNDNPHASFWGEKQLP